MILTLGPPNMLQRDLHSRIHSPGERPFSPRFCGSEFRRPVGLGAGGDLKLEATKHW